MAPKKTSSTAPTNLKRGRPAKPPSATLNPTITKSTTGTPKRGIAGSTKAITPAAAAASPSKRTPARQAKTDATIAITSPAKSAEAMGQTQSPATKLPAKKRGRPPGKAIAYPSTAARGTKTRPSSDLIRKSYQKAPIQAPVRPRAGGIVKRRGRPPKSQTVSFGGTSTVQKSSKARAAGRPKGKRVPTLTTSLKTLIANATKERLVETLTTLCRRSALFAKATGNYLQRAATEAVQSEADLDGEAEVEAEGEVENAVAATNGDTSVEASEVAGITSKKTAKAKSKKSNPKPKVAATKTTKTRTKNKKPPQDKLVATTTSPLLHTATTTTADSSNAVIPPEPKSGYEADVEPEIPTATPNAAAANNTTTTAMIPESVIDAVAAVRDVAFGL